MVLVVLLTCIVAFLAFAATVLYVLLGRHRYGGDKPANILQLTADAAAMRKGSLNPETVRIVRVYFIKPSRYDEDGYVSVFRYGVQPNNTLNVLSALNDEFNRHFSGKRNVHSRPSSGTRSAMVSSARKPLARSRKRRMRTASSC